MGGWCAYLQSTTYSMEFVGEIELSIISKYLQLPMFQLYLVRPYIGVVGTVFCDIGVCEPLVTVIPLYYLLHDMVMMQMVAHMFMYVKQKFLYTSFKDLSIEISI